MQHSQDRSGEYVGDYRLLHRRGLGTFGEVYQAEDRRSHHPVAVKLLKTPLTHREDLKAFLNEARTFRLHHPHIVPLLDFGLSEHDLPFLVMEYVAGGTLRDHYPKGSKVPLDVVVDLTSQLASALQYAHDQHLVHRDVKPENMLCRSDGTVLLSDFGIASVAHASSSRSVYEGVGGTLPYMAPEQIEGKPRRESDQYALAVVVYEWLAGARPFQGTAPELIPQHLHTPPPRLLDQVPTLPAAVEQVVFKALAKQPQERFACVQDFAEALQAASQLTVAPSPTTSPSPSVLPSLEAGSAPAPISPSSPTVATPSDWSTSVSTRPAQAAPERDVTLSTPTSPATSDASVPGERETVRPPTSHTDSLSVVSHALTPPPLAFPPARLRRRLSGRALLLFLLAALLLGSGSLGYWAFQNSVAQSQATATANARASATSNALATTVAGELATEQANLTTATAQAQATAGVLQTATSGQPTSSDLLTAGQVTDPTWMNDGTSCFFAADGYHVHLPPSAPPANGHSCAESDRSYGNATITVEMRIHGGYSGGLLIRLQSAQFPIFLGYFFEVGIGGNYEIHRINAGSFTTLQDWTDSSAINGGLDSLNVLQVIAHGNDFRFYVNGVYLTHVQDALYGVGAIGFVSQTDTTGPGDAVFSNLRVYP